MTKTVALSDQAYELLSRFKQPRESFSGVVIRLTHERKKSLLPFAGIWKNDKEIDRIFKKIKKDRGASHPRKAVL